MLSWVDVQVVVGVMCKAVSTASNPQRKQGRTRPPDKDKYLIGETSDCKKNGLIRKKDVFSGMNKMSSV